jgi:hypothetical protein
VASAKGEAPAFRPRLTWRRPVAACAFVLVLASAASASAVDLGPVAATDVQLDVTETTISAQHFDARGNELPQDSGWGDWINRLDAALRWGRWTAGLRLDSAVYWRRPIDNPDFDRLPFGFQEQVIEDSPSRFKNSVYPAKLWIAYSAPSIDVTVGDAYVQFGRGLTLSMRKIDELGIDTTLRGVKVLAQSDPFAFTAVAGFGNPARVDEATGRDLFPTTGAPPVPMFGSDRIVGAEVETGRGLPVTLGSRVVRISRCAPYHYDAVGHIGTDFFSDPGAVTFGTCDASDTATWLQSLPDTPPGLRANDTTMVGQSIEVPTLAGHGKLYIEAAGQWRRQTSIAGPPNDTGNAVYGALSLDAGPVSGTLEVKSNRNFYAVPIGANVSLASEFNNVTYSFTPPAETATILDTEFGNFNACVNGGRLRGDLRTSDNVLAYAQGIFAYTQSEQTSGGCDAQGHTLASVPVAQAQDDVWDGLVGLEWTFDGSLSHVFASAGIRDDTKATGDFNYRERHLEYSIVKYFGAGKSLEMQGFHRNRKEEDQNRISVGGGPSAEAWWYEGENYIALKIAPSWVFSQGFEYTTLTGQPTFYVNGSVLYKFTSASNVRLFVGQQRGAFRCAAGVCRYFPPFEGARAELTWRF